MAGDVVSLEQRCEAQERREALDREVYGQPVDKTCGCCGKNLNAGAGVLRAGGAGVPQDPVGADDHERAKLDRLAPAIQAALARRDPPREAPAGYSFPAFPQA
jgi:hypothetical protein